LKSAADRVDGVRRARELLTTAGAAISINSQLFVRLAGHITEVRNRFANNPASLTEPGAYQAGDITNALAGAEQSLLESWQRHVRAGGHTRLVDVFEHFGRRDVADRLRTISRGLEQLSAALPRRSDDVRRVSDLKAEGLEVIRHSQFGEDLDFLEESIGQGVPLSTLLDDSERIERLRRFGILDVLRVVAS
jgi:hypothetical protein